jgi:outer membrane immunogenic protein
MDSFQQGGFPMNKLLIATAAVALATAGTAGAADLPMKAPPMVPPPAMTWTGCWVSGGIGYGMWNQDHFGETTTGLVQLEPNTTSGGRGWLGRVGVGCDYQFSSSFLVGAFGDYDFMSLKGTWNDPLAQGPAVVGDEKETGAWAAGLRLGYLPYPNLLTFVSGGWTQTRFDQINFSTNTNPSVALTTGILAQRYSGWFIGGGTEYAVPWGGFHGLFWKTEYRFSSYRPVDVTEVVLATGAPIGLSDHMEKNVQTVTTSLVWRFNFGGPVVARY